MISAFRKVFKTPHTFLPVIHVKEPGLAIRSAKIASNAGADGIFLINHDYDGKHLISVRRLIKMELPTFWIGLNCLDLGQNALTVIPADTDGLWVDNGGVHDTDTQDAQAMAALRRGSTWSGILFGGVAFKGQRPVTNCAQVARDAIPFMDVVTTSGRTTGEAPTVDKISRMKNALGNHPLAIASGITVENIHDFMPYADCFMVATGISDSFTELNSAKTTALAKILGK